MALRPAIEHSAYDADARERFLDEPAKRPGRTEFSRDRARIIHSFALRRLAAKPKLQFRGLVIFQELDFHIL